MDCDKTGARAWRLRRALADRTARRVGWTALTAGIAASLAFVGTRVFFEDLGWVVALALGELAWCAWTAAWLRCQGRSTLWLIALTALSIAAGTWIGTLGGWGTVASWFASGAPAFTAVLIYALWRGAGGARPRDLAPGRRRSERRSVRVVAGAVVWPLLLAPIALGGLVLWRAADAPPRVAFTPADLSPPNRLLGPPPDLARIDDALRLADMFIAGLYVPDGVLAAGRHYPVMSEYYALPVRVQRLGDRSWRLLGQPGNSARELARGPAGETSLLTFDDLGTGTGARAPQGFELLADVDWDYRPGYFRVRLRLAGGVSPGRPVRVQIGQTDAGVWRTRDSTVERVLVVPLAERRRLRSTRDTIRHATIDGYWWLRYHGDPRAAGMRATVRLAGLHPDRDLYSPMWWGARASTERGAAPRGVGEDMVFAAELYRDCRRVPPATTLHLQYRSKVCRVPLDAYRWLSFSDPEAEAAQALQIAQQRGPDATYRDLDLRRRTPRETAQRLERQVQASDWLGLSRCHPLRCETGWVTSTRTLLFGALEAELGYRAGDAVSRSYADLVARIALRVQVPRSGAVTAWRTRLYRPLQIGGFYTAWSSGWVGGPVPSRQSEAIDALEARLDMPREYEGYIASNAETTLAAYAFLVRYRCLRWRVGCDKATSPIPRVALRDLQPATTPRSDRFAAVRTPPQGRGHPHGVAARVDRR